MQHEALAQKITEMIRACKDNDLLDLIYKLLLESSQ